MKKSKADGSGLAVLNGSGKVLDRIRASTRENFADVVLECAPGSLEALVEKYPAAKKLLEGKFASFVMHPGVAPSDVMALDNHPVVGQVVGSVVQGQKRLTPVGRRTLTLLEAATKSRKTSEVKNVYPFLPVPQHQHEALDPYHDIR